MRNALKFFVVLAIVLIAPICGAQDLLGSIKLPDLSSVDVSASADAVVASKPESEQPSKTDRILFRSSQWSHVGTALLDDVTTGWFMTHPQVASYCLEGGPTLCTHSVTKTISWSEAGWTAGLVGKKSPTKTLLLSAAVDTGIFLTSRALYNHGGVWRKIGIGLNFVQAAGHLQGGIRNLRSRANQARGLVPAGAFDISR